MLQPNSKLSPNAKKKARIASRELLITFAALLLEVARTDSLSAASLSLDLLDRAQKELKSMFPWERP